MLKRIFLCATLALSSLLALPASAATLTFNDPNVPNVGGATQLLIRPYPWTVEGVENSYIQLQSYSGCANVGDTCGTVRLWNKAGNAPSSTSYSYMAKLSGPNGDVRLDIAVTEFRDDVAGAKDQLRVGFIGPDGLSYASHPLGYAFDTTFKTAAQGGYTSIHIKLIEPFGDATCWATPETSHGAPYPCASARSAAPFSLDAPAPVPVPAALPLAGLGLASLVGLKRLRRRG